MSTQNRKKPDNLPEFTFYNNVVGVVDGFVDDIKVAEFYVSHRSKQEGNAKLVQNLEEAVEVIHKRIEMAGCTNEDDKVQINGKGDLMSFY
jgi:SOS response regulatory protein OraA/RecX